MERIEFNCQTGITTTIQLTEEEIAAIEAKVIPAVIPTLTRLQAKLSLLNLGLLDDVEALMTTQEQLIWWNDAPTFERDHPLVVSVLGYLGKTEAEIDQMFIDAASL